MVFDVLTHPRLLQNCFLFLPEFDWCKNGCGLAKGFGFAESEDMLRTPVPGRDETVEAPGDDRIVRGFHDGSESESSFLGLLALGNILHRTAEAGHIAGRIAHCFTTSSNPTLNPISAH